MGGVLVALTTTTKIKTDNIICDYFEDCLDIFVIHCGKNEMIFREICLDFRCFYYFKNFFKAFSFNTLLWYYLAKWFRMWRSFVNLFVPWLAVPSRRRGHHQYFGHEHQPEGRQQIVILPSLSCVIYFITPNIDW